MLPTLNMTDMMLATWAIDEGWDDSATFDGVGPFPPVREGSINGIARKATFAFSKIVAWRCKKSASDCMCLIWGLHMLRGPPILS